MEENTRALNNQEEKLLGDLVQLIEKGRRQATAKVNSTLTMTYWQVGRRINHDILQNQRAEYGKRVIPALAQQLVQQFGKSFEARNLRRMMQFAEEFPDFEIVSSLMSQLSWTHFIQLFSLSSKEAKMFYANKIAEEGWSVRFTRKQIEQKAYERAAIADAKMAVRDTDMQQTFKDPYFLDFLGLKDGYVEGDLENAILKELEQFILELGTGFAFIERQKRMVIDNEDFYLDLLFYHRKLKRLVAVDLKIGKFKAAYKGQMELYLNWLNQYERQAEEEAPIGLILCAEAGSEQVELMNLQKDGIMVAEYWTELPPKKLLEEKLHAALLEARERMERRKLE